MQHFFGLEKSFFPILFDETTLRFLYFSVHIFPYVCNLFVNSCFISRHSFPVVSFQSIQWDSSISVFFLLFCFVLFCGLLFLPLIALETFISLNFNHTKQLQFNMNITFTNIIYKPFRSSKSSKQYWLASIYSRYLQVLLWLLESLQLTPQKPLLLFDASLHFGCDWCYSYHLCREPPSIVKAEPFMDQLSPSAWYRRSCSSFLNWWQKDVFPSWMDSNSFP